MNTQIVLMEGNADITLAALYARRQPLAVRLGQALSNTPPDTDRAAGLHRTYRRLTPADQLRCRAEMLDCRAAKMAGYV